MAVATKSRSARSVSARPAVKFLVLNGRIGDENFEPQTPSDFPVDLADVFSDNTVRGEYDTVEEAMQKAMDDNETFIQCALTHVWSYVVVKPISQPAA